VNVSLKQFRNILLLYWVIYYLLISLVEAGPQQHYSEAFLSNLVSLPVKFVFVMITVGPLMNKFILKKRILVFSLVYFSLLILFAAVLRVVDNQIILPYILTHWDRLPLFEAPVFLYNVIKLQFVAAIPFMIKLFSYWTETELRSTQYHRQKQEAELSFLRNQFNPHFLFNALNTLYSKILTNPAEASGVVLKLCSLLRFSLYEANQSSIPLSKEVEYLSNYVELQKTRFGDQINISFSIFGNKERGAVEPFLILPFIENSFKHCQPNNDAQSWITVQISIEHEHVIAIIDNSYLHAAPSSENNSKGVGQSNVQKRLQLLFPGNHVMRCERGEENYYVYLKFPLIIHGD
jgi:two-component system, LytTR family, sensor kinase